LNNNRNHSGLSHCTDSTWTWYGICHYIFWAI